MTPSPIQPGVPAPISLAAPKPEGTVVTLTRPAGLEKDSGFKEALEAVGPASRPGMPFGPRPERKQVAAYDLDPSQRTLRMTQATKGDGTFLFGPDGFTLGDLIDIINPLQHLPIIGAIYRWLTGDEISPAASLAGGALFGGPIGLAAAAGGIAFEQATGNDPGATLMAAVTGDEKAGWTQKQRRHDAPSAETTTLAEAAPRATAAPAPATAAPASETMLAAAAPAFVSDRSRGADSSLPASFPTVSLSEDQLTKLLARSDAAKASPAPADVPSGELAERMLLGLRKYDGVTKSRAAQAAGARSVAALDIAS